MRKLGIIQSTLKVANIAVGADKCTQGISHFVEQSKSQQIVDKTINKAGTHPHDVPLLSEASEESQSNSSLDEFSDFIGHDSGYFTTEC